MIVFAICRLNPMKLVVKKKMIIKKTALEFRDTVKIISAPKESQNRNYKSPRNKRREESFVAKFME